MNPTSDSGATAGTTSVSGIPDLDGASLFAFADMDLPSGPELYDRIMGAIEPELMSGSVGGLKAKYAGETPEEKEVRAKRYAKAYAEYDEQYAQYQLKRDSSMLRYKAQALQSLEASSKKVEENEMSDLEAQIHSA